MKYFALIITLLVTTGSFAQVRQKRMAPKEARPIIVNKIKYSAPTNEMGYVVARELATDAVIWKKQIYDVHYDKDMEQDVQDIFIDSLTLLGNYLMVHTENNKTYRLKLN